MLLVKKDFPLPGNPWAGGCSLLRPLLPVDSRSLASPGSLGRLRGRGDGRKCPDEEQPFRGWPSHLGVWDHFFLLGPLGGDILVSPVTRLHIRTALCDADGPDRAGRRITTQE